MSVEQNKEFIRRYFNEVQMGLAPGPRQGGPRSR
jgi:hypothetical protein